MEGELNEFKGEPVLNRQRVIGIGSGRKVIGMNTITISGDILWSILLAFTSTVGQGRELLRQNIRGISLYEQRTWVRTICG